ncbi:MAG: tRNA (guanosine(37)-N1)-methyltransferase TrmD [Peptococcaceae bacterium]|nr:tRNA (guanosine(37)-N1)-methyltransferase TrmD [Peptococcaceae bacterium]
MNLHILTIFPEMFVPLQESIVKRARAKGLINVNLVNFRDYAPSKHKNVDDYPYGGGVGMVLKPEPIFAAVDALPAGCDRKIILMSPQGRRFDHSLADELSREQELVFICGHYEGFDERIRSLADMEVSIGDYVLTGGELPAMVVIDAVARLIPGVLGEAASSQSDSFTEPFLEYPQFTRPETYAGMQVPTVLLSGNHALVAAWRRKESLRKTLQQRPDLFRPDKLQPSDFVLLRELMQEDAAINSLSHLWLAYEPPAKAKLNKTRRHRCKHE